MTYARVLRNDPQRDWTCDCGNVEKYYRTHCTVCGLKDANREVEQ